MAKLSDSRNSDRSDRRKKYLKPNLGGRKSGARKLATLIQGLALEDETPLSPTSAKSPSPNLGITTTPLTPDAPMRLVRRPPSRRRGGDLRQVTAVLFKSQNSLCNFKPSGKVLFFEEEMSQARLLFDGLSLDS